MTTRVFLDGIEGSITNGQIRVGGLTGRLVGDLTDGTIYLGGLVGAIVGGVVRYGSVYGAVVDGVLHLDGLLFTGTPTPPIPPVPPTGEWITVFDESANPTPGDPEILLSTTVRSLVTTDYLLAGTKIRFTITAAGFVGYNGIDVNAAYVQTAGVGDAYDFSAAPVPLLVAGQTAYFIPPDTSVVTDAAVLDIDALTNLVVSMQFGSISATAHTYSVVDGAVYYKVGQDAATVNATGYTSYLSERIWAIAKIEIFVPA